MSRFKKIKKRLKGKKKMSNKNKPQGPQPEQQQQTGQPDQPKIIGQIVIDVYENLNVLVKNFPDGYGVSMTVLINAMSAVNQFFMQKQQEAESPIVIAKPGMSPADIEKIAKKN